MAQTRKDLHGVIVPVVTPVDEDDRVDAAAFRKCIRHVLGAGAHGVFVGGSAGMGPLLVESQWRRAVTIAREEVGPGHYLLGGTMAASTARAVEKIRILEAIGYEHAVVTPTYYIDINRHEEMLCHFGRCRDAADMRLVAYNVPSCTHSMIPVETIAQMARREWICACKESSGDRAYFGEVLEKTRGHGVRLFQGNEPLLNWSLSLGVDGIVPVCANFEPGTFVCLRDAVLRGDKELAERAQARIMHIREVLLINGDNWVAGIMYGVSRLGIGSGRPVSPLQEVGPPAKLGIDALQPVDLTDPS